ncbi:MAG: hypothetical protein L0323_05975 [Planctomycetes bacterium]|nr:hypothetical protein [Planctomycetota bacterium]
MKDCDRLATALLFRADGGPPGEDSAAIERHVRDCSACASRERETRARIGLLRSLPRTAAPEALDRAVEAEIAALEASPADSRERLVSRWLSRVGRLPVPAALDARVLQEIGGSAPSARRRLFGLSAAAAAAAAALLLVWTALFSTEEPLRGATLVIRDVGRDEMRNPGALGFAPGPSRELVSLPPPQDPRRRVASAPPPGSRVSADALPLPATGLGSLAVTPRRLAFVGEREVTISRDGVVLRKFVERVKGDGTGEPKVEPIRLDGWSAEEFRAAGRAAEWADFANSYAGRTGFFATNRDFAVVDAELLLENYTIEEAQGPAPILDRPTGRARFRRNFDGQTLSVAWDVETGLVLEVEESPSPGRLAVAMRYGPVQYASRPSPSPPVVVEPAEEEPPPGYLPHALPPGFRHRQAFGRQIPGGETARVDEYTDGIDRLFLFQQPAPGSNSPASPFVEIRRLNVGAIELLEVDLPDALVTVVGKLATEDLKIVLASLRR